jgi:hypothetical protein
LSEAGRNRLKDLVSLVFIIHNESEKVSGKSQFELGDVSSFLDSDGLWNGDLLLLASDDFEELLQVGDNLRLN